jgi:hypothetical protein
MLVYIFSCRHKCVTFSPPTVTKGNIRCCLDVALDEEWLGIVLAHVNDAIRHEVGILHHACRMTFDAVLEPSSSDLQVHIRRRLQYRGVRFSIS